MPTPRLIHPVNVTFVRLNRDEMVMDDDAREPIHGVRSGDTDTFTIPCQVSWNKFDDPQPNIGGVVTSTVGYFLARSIDMDRILGTGERIQRGDRITGYASTSGTGESVPCNLYVIRGDPYGHYPNEGATLYKYQVTDRDPVQ